MSKQREIRLIIRELMDRPEYRHLSYNDILNIVYYSQYGFVHNMMSNADKYDFDSYKSVMLKYMGSFIAHPKKVDLYVERNKKKLDEESSEPIPSE